MLLHILHVGTDLYVDRRQTVTGKALDEGCNPRLARALH